MGAWNIHVGEVDAGASGIPVQATIPPVPPPLGSEARLPGIVRLLCPNAGLALPMAAKLVPHYTKVMVIGNTTDYAGAAGGDVSTVSLAPEARDVGVHELSHSFAGLADEYTDLQVNYPYPRGPSQHHHLLHARAGALAHLDRRRQARPDAPATRNQL